MSKDPNTIYVGTKPAMSYVLAVITHFNESDANNCHRRRRNSSPQVHERTKNQENRNWNRRTAEGRWDKKRFNNRNKLDAVKSDSLDLKQKSPVFAFSFFLSKKFRFNCV